MNCAARIVHVGQHQYRNAAVDCGLELAPFHQPDGMIATEEIGQPLRDVEIGRKVGGLGQNEVAPGLKPERPGQQLEEVHRRAIRDDHLTRPGADQASDLVADPDGRFNPVGVVPAADQSVAPLFGNHLIQPRDCLPRQRPK